VGRQIPRDRIKKGYKIIKSRESGWEFHKGQSECVWGHWSNHESPYEK